MLQSSVLADINLLCLVLFSKGSWLSMKTRICWSSSIQRWFLLLALYMRNLLYYIYSVQLLLGYLPTDRDFWPHELQKKRSRYSVYKEEFLLNPVSYNYLPQQLVDEYIYWSLIMLYRFIVYNAARKWLFCLQPRICPNNEKLMGFRWYCSSDSIIK